MQRESHPFDHARLLASLIGQPTTTLSKLILQKHVQLNNCFYMVNKLEGELHSSMQSPNFGVRINHLFCLLSSLFLFRSFVQFFLFSKTVMKKAKKFDAL